MSGACRGPDKPKRLRSEKEVGDDEDYVDTADELPLGTGTSGGAAGSGGIKDAMATLRMTLLLICRKFVQELSPTRSPLGVDKSSRSLYGCLKNTAAVSMTSFMFMHYRFENSPSELMLSLCGGKREPRGGREARKVACGS